MKVKIKLTEETETREVLLTNHSCEVFLNGTSFKMQGFLTDGERQKAIDKRLKAIKQDYEVEIIER